MDYMRKYDNYNEKFNHCQKFMKKFGRNPKCDRD